LEVADQLLAVAEQDAVLERAARDAAVHALDEPPILVADLRVELHQVVDPSGVDVRAEEVVEEAVGAVGADRHDRADRDVRAAGEDVDAEVGPQEMELRSFQLALDLHARTHRSALAREPPLGREPVGVGRDVDHL